MDFDNRIEDFRRAVERVASLQATLESLTDGIARRNQIPVMIGDCGCAPLGWRSTRRLPPCRKSNSMRGSGFLLEDRLDRGYCGPPSAPVSRAGNQGKSSEIGRWLPNLGYAVRLPPPHTPPANFISTAAIFHYYLRGTTTDQP